MKSITIHGLEDNVYLLVKKQAQQLGLSLNKTLHGMIIDSLGIKKKTKDHRPDFLEFYGCWDKEETKAFMQNTADFSQIDIKDWQ